MQKKMYRVPFHLRVAMLLWYIYWLASQISYIDTEAEQIKHNAVVFCNSSESSINTVLGMSHTVAVSASVRANLEIQQFVNSTSEIVIDGLDVIYFIFRQSINLFKKRIRCVIGAVTYAADIGIDEFVSVAQSKLIIFDDPVFGSSTQHPTVWSLLPTNVWDEVVQAIKDAVGSLVDLQLSDRVTFVEAYADSMLDQLDPSRYGLQEDLQKYLSKIVPSLNLAVPEKQAVSYCNDLDWKEFDDSVDFIKTGVYLSLAIISTILLVFITTKWTYIYKRSSKTNETVERRHRSILTKVVHYVVKDKSRLVTAFIGLYGLIQIGIDLYLLKIVSDRLEVFTDNHIRPTAIRATAQWDAAEAKIWEPYINSTNSYIMNAEGSTQSYLFALQNYIDNRTGFIGNSKRETENFIYDSLGVGFGVVILRAIECATPIFMIDEFAKEVIDYVSSRKINLPVLQQPTIFQVNEESVNKYVDQMDAQIKKFVDWYSESIRKNIAFYAFLAIYGSGIFLYDCVEYIYKKLKNVEDIDLPVVQ